ncbi:hypothetical protein [Neobacillus drentensis]
MDGELFRMLNEIEEHYAKETGIGVSLDKLIEELIILHYYAKIEIKK